MKTAYRFILKAYVGPMILTFFIVMFILLMHFMWQYIDELVGKGLSGGVIAELIMYAAATLIPMGLPLATLLASIMTLGNLGENNELLALKAAGVSLPKIMKPLIILMTVISVSSFFAINNLAPYSYQKMFTLLSDISKQRQEMKFKDGVFFNGIPDMSIRVSHQDPNTNLLTNVLIYDNSAYEKMRTTVADSGYIRISDDRLYLEVTLFNGQVYEENRNYEWYSKNTLSHHIFSRQDMLVPISGFAMQRSDMEGFGTRSETKNIGELTIDIDSLYHVQDSITRRFSNSFIKNYIFKQYATVDNLDSLPTYKDYQYIVANVDTMDVAMRQTVFKSAKTWANDAKSFTNYEVEFARYTSNLLYRAQAEYQRKIALPFSIMIFFLIGAPLGAIIRKGGIGTPIVVSIIFFVIYYIISITGDKLVKDGAIHPFIGMWLASFILFPIAIFLTYKSTNDSALFKPDAYIAKYKHVKSKITNTYERYFKHNRRSDK